jgi:preprotein translocase subunit SecF
MEFFNPNTNFDFLRWRKISLTVSAVLMLACAVLIFGKGLHYGMDFTGGSRIEAHYEQPAEIAEVRGALTEAGYANAVVQAMGTGKEYVIRIPPQAAEEAAKATPETKPVAGETKSQSDRVTAAVLSALKAKRADASVKPSEFIGPQVGEELRSDGLIAVIFVIMGIMFYLWIRFEWRFAVAAVASEVHDTLLTVGVFALTGREFDLTALAAVLSVVGYSINDKVVVFDRVREIFRAARKGEPVDILNRSINSTLSRTIMTGLTTGLAVGALWLAGGPAVQNFGLIMVIGIVIGTLSSIFFANPILLWLGVSKKDLMPVTRDDPELERRP